MNLLHLEYFYNVAKENGFTNASKVLHIQQPAISRMVKQLEDNFGFRLFEKVGRNVQLTKQGADVFENCKQIFGEVERLKASLRQISGTCQGSLMIGASEPISSHFLPQVLHSYLKKHPKVHPNIFSGPASFLFSEIISGKIEFGIFFHVPNLPDKLEVFEQKMFRHHLVIRRDLKNNKDKIESFIGSREIDDVSTRRFPTIERMRREYPNTKIKISSNNLTAHKDLVLKGLGASILPDFLVEREIKSGRLIDLYPKEVFEFQMKFVKRKTAILSLNSTELIRVCLNR